MDNYAWPIILAVFVAILGLLQALLVGGVFGIFRKILEIERRLSSLEGIGEERGRRVQRLEREINHRAHEGQS